jgi:hypothetical protein
VVASACKESNPSGGVGLVRIEVEEYTDGANFNKTGEVDVKVVWLGSVRPVSCISTSQRASNIEDLLPKQTRFLVPQRVHATAWFAATDSPTSQVSDLLQAQLCWIEWWINVHRYWRAMTNVSNIQHLCKPFSSILGGRIGYWPLPRRNPGYARLASHHIEETRWRHGFCISCSQGAGNSGQPDRINTTGWEDRAKEV